MSDTTDFLKTIEVRDPDVDNLVWLVFNNPEDDTRGMINLGTGDRLVARAALAFEVRRAAFLSMRDTPKTIHANTIHTQAYGADGKQVLASARDSENPHRDTRIMEAAIEFFYAVQRGVDITPTVLWKHVMGKEWVEPK